MKAFQRGSSSSFTIVRDSFILAPQPVYLSAPRAGLMLHEIKYLMMAVQFLTRLPVARISGLNPNQPELSGKYFPQRGAKYLPVVGLFIGLVCAVVLLLASLVWQGALPALIAGLNTSPLAAHSNAAASACCPS